MTILNHINKPERQRSTIVSKEDLDYEIEDPVSEKPLSSHFQSSYIDEDYEGPDLAGIVKERRCCQMNGRLGDKYCSICGRVIPEKWIITPK